MTTTPGTPKKGRPISAFVIESWGHIEPEPEPEPKPIEDDPWAEFDRELEEGIRRGEFYVDEYGEVKRRVKRL